MARARIACHVFPTLCGAWIAALCALPPLAVRAAPASGGKSPATAPIKLTATQRLAANQQQVAARFKRFEEVLLRMAELTAAADPKRAALLRRAVAQSKEQTIGLQMDKLAEVLASDKLAAALTDQQTVSQELGQLLELLLSEQRSERLKDERERLKRQIQLLKELINKQVELKAETARAPALQELAPPQARLAEEAGRLARDLQGPEKPGGANPAGEDKKPTDGQQPSSEEKPAGKPNGIKPASSKPDKSSSKESPATGKPSEKAKPKSGDGQQPSQSGQQPPGKQSQSPSESKPSGGKQPKSSGQPQQGQPSQSPQGEHAESEPSESEQAAAPDQQESPGRKRVAAARKAMEEAQKKLEQAKREGAERDQQEALRQLEQAKAELEEILRQMRDEEVERVLTQLEARFRQMLAMEREVYEGTRRVDQVPQAKRGRGEEIEAGRLSRRQAMIVVEAEKALAVLHEEGSAVALPEAVEEMREDMETVVSRLAQAKADAQTQGIEEDIIAALEETIAALQKAQRDRQSKKSLPPPGGQPQEPPLVDRLAELKMIRALQMRVNTRTQRYSKLVSGDEGQSDTPDLVEALKKLAEREQRIFRATRDIVVGKNQ